MKSADHIGDSLGLSQQGSSTNADLIVFTNVHFTAETTKILSFVTYRQILYNLNHSPIDKIVDGKF
ncbi:quinolinate synthase NadA [Brasilonema sp. UFV-L1]|uniref:quinolinate synthase NadA n=1 Tax=Brasilonema sp. UFV-L1 TaxID=2234130 RepID=UPI00403F427D